MNEKKSFYVVMPTWLYESQDIPDKAKRLYAIIVSLASKEGFCWASNAYFAEQLKVTRRTIIRYINLLEVNNLIKAERGENERKIYLQYVLKGDLDGGGSVNRVTGGSDKVKGKMSQGSDTDKGKMSHPYNIIDNIIISDSAKKPNTEVAPDSAFTDLKEEEGEKKSKAGKPKGVIELCNWYEKVAHETIGGDPRVSYVARGGQAVLKLLKKYTLAELKAILTWYLDNDKFNKYPQITAALSNDTLRLYSRDIQDFSLIYDKPKK